jgi:oligoribonuclease
MDPEMTGLDPTRDVIVEIATLITDDSLEIVAEGPDLVIHHSRPDVRRPHGRRGARHTRSGLPARDRGIDDHASRTPESRRWRSWSSICPAPAPSRCAATASAPTAASSPRPPRHRGLPALPIDRCLEHQGAREALVSGEVGRTTAQGAQPPRLDDIRESVAELRYYRDEVFAPRSKPEPTA